MGPETSLTLLERLRREPADSPQWKRLDDFCKPFIQQQLRFRFRLGEQDAEDLAQDIMEVVCRKIVAFDHQRKTGSFRGWLRGITHHQLQKFWREQKKNPQLSGDVDPFVGLADDRSDLSREWDEQHSRHVVTRSLELLRRDFDPRSVEAFRLLIMEEVPGPEVAGRLGMTLAAVHSARARILKRLREEAREFLC